MVRGARCRGLRSVRLASRSPLEATPREGEKCHPSRRRRRRRELSAVHLAHNVPHLRTRTVRWAACTHFWVQRKRGSRRAKKQKKRKWRTTPCWCRLYSSVHHLKTAVSRGERGRTLQPRRSVRARGPSRERAKLNEGGPRGEEDTETLNTGVSPRNAGLICVFFFLHLLVPSHQRRSGGVGV